MNNIGGLQDSGEGVGRPAQTGTVSTIEVTAELKNKFYPTIFTSYVSTKAHNYVLYYLVSQLLSYGPPN